MTCPTCKQGMNAIGDYDSRRVQYWCSHCGTLVKGRRSWSPEREIVDLVLVPGWTEAKKEEAQ